MMIGGEVEKFLSSAVLVDGTAESQKLQNHRVERKSIVQKHIMY